MPRPKRTKIVSAHAKAQQAAAAAQAAATTHQIASSNLDGDQYMPSLASKTGKRTSRTVRQGGIDIAMSGALGLGDVEAADETHLGSSRGNRPRAQDTSISKLGSLGKRQRTTTSSTRPPLVELSPGSRSTNQNRGSGKSKASANGPSKSPAQCDKRASVAVDDGFEEYLRSSSPHLPTTVISRPPSASKVQGTPSFLSIANFKRRPRQPSILRMVQQKVGENARADHDHNDDDNDDDDVTLNDIASPQSSTAVRGASGSKKRKSAALEPGDEIGSSAEKRPRSMRQDRATSSPAIQGYVTAPVSSSSPPKDADQNDEEASPSDSSPELPPIPPSKQPPAAAVRKTPTRRGRGRRMPPKRPPRAASPSPPISDESPVSSPSSGAEEREDTVVKRKSRAARGKTATTRAANSRTITTQSLQSLLPRRRMRLPEIEQGPFDALTSSDPVEDDTEENTSDVVAVQYSDGRSGDSSSADADDGEDELTTSRRATRTARHLPAKEAKSKQKHEASREERRVSKTYSRRRQQSKVDESDSAIQDSKNSPNEGPDGRKAASKTLQAPPKTKELTEAAKKFQDIDNWDMSFESVDVGGDSSSPWR